MFCRSCKYKLVGLEVLRCPECGRPFNPGDPSTFLLSDKSTVSSKIGWALLAVFLTFVALIILICLPSLIYIGIAIYNGLFNSNG